MRPAVLSLALVVGACASIGSSEPLTAEQEAGLVIQALETGCRDMGTPDNQTRRALSEGWLRVVPKAEYTACAVEVDGMPVRIEAVDKALGAYSHALNLTWNVRDSSSLPENGRIDVRRTRGEHGVGEPEMTWRFVQFEEGEDLTTLRVEWSDRGL